MDVLYPVIVVAPIAGLALNCLTQVGATRARLAKSPYVSMTAGIVVGIIVTAVITMISNSKSKFAICDRISFQALNIGIYLALAFGYFNFVNLTIASLRIRLLGELAASGGLLHRKALLDAYNTEKVISLRIDRLVRGGHLIVRGDRYFIGKRRFLMVAVAYNILRCLVIGPWPGEPMTRSR